MEITEHRLTLRRRNRRKKTSSPTNGNTTPTDGAHRMRRTERRRQIWKRANAISQQLQRYRRQRRKYIETYWIRRELTAVTRELVQQQLLCRRLRVNSVSFYCSAGARVQARLAQFCADCVRSCDIEGKTKILLEHHCGDCRGKFIS